MGSLIKIEGKPIEKLIEVVSNAIGSLFEPRQIIRKAKAEAKAESIHSIEQAKTKAIIDGDTEKAQYLETINERLMKKETKRQKNIENVVSIAGNVLQTEDKVSEEPIHPDWVTRFFDIAQDVSDNDMQLLWGQILAGEIKQPKSYSLRTLEILRNMSKDEAELFQKVAQFSLSQGDVFLFSEDDVLGKFGISYSNIAKLVEIGLLQPGDFVQRQYQSDKIHDRKISIIYGNILINIRQKANSQKIGIPIRLFTTPGKELSKLVNIVPNMEYITIIANSIKNENVNVSYATIIGFHKNGSQVYTLAETKL